MINPASMIASLSGMILEVGSDFLIIECAGVGYCVNVTPTCASQFLRDEFGKIHTTLVVREDAMTLYGFFTPAERTLFQQLQTVNGVGPRLALAILAALSPAEIYHAFAQSDIAQLTRVSGVGKKVAERLIMELKDKLVPFGTIDAPKNQAASAISTPSLVKNTTQHPQQDVIDALVGLGFKAAAATEAVDAIMIEDNTVEPADLIRQALSFLGKNR